MSRAILKHSVWLILVLVGHAVSPVGVQAADKSGVATVSDATKVLDLMKLPVLENAQEPVSRSVASLSYLTKGSCQAAYEFHKKSLVKLKWTEAPGSSVTEQYASGTFTNHGFVASLSVSPSYDPQQQGMVNVSVILHGNVDLKSLPMPKGMKSVYVGPQVAMFSTTASVEETQQACRDLLLKAGWEPYGETPGSMWLKQNAVRLTASVSSAPAQGGQTMVSYSSEQLSADIPAPSDTVQLQYSDSTKQLLFDTKQSAEEILAFYQKTLSGRGWKVTTENPIQSGFREQLIFRNPAKEMFTLEWYPVKEEEVLRVTLKFQTAAEVDALDKAVAEMIAEKKKQMEAEKNTKLPVIEIALPAGAEVTEESAQVLEFTLPSGKAKAALDQLRKSLRDSGWKEEVTLAEAVAGEISLKKGDQEISLSYVDPGFIAAEVTIKGNKVALAKKK